MSDPAPKPAPLSVVSDIWPARLKQLYNVRGKSQMRLKSFFFSKPALVLFSTLTTLLFVVSAYEIYARYEYRQWRKPFKKMAMMATATIASPNEKMMWEYRPYATFKRLQFNRWGFREVDYPTAQKPPNVYRVAFAGDSVTLGMMVDEDKSFVRRYEIGANATNPAKRIQALNFGVDGYNTPQVEEMIRVKVLPFEPDRIVYVFCLNDFDFSDSSGNKIRYFNPPKSFLLDKWDLIYQRITRADFHRYHFEKNKQIVFDSIKGMKDIAGRKLEIVVLPVFPGYLNNYQGYAYFDIHDEINAFIESQHIRHIDLLDVFSKRSEPVRHWAFDVWHPNPAGHQLIADTLVQAISLD